MANLFSTEWTASYIASPPGNVYGYKSRLRLMEFTFPAATAAGTAGDIWFLGKIPPKATVTMFRTAFGWTGFTTGATLSIGWEAYRDEDGLQVAANAAGLLSAMSLTVAGLWNGGALLVPTPDDFLPVVTRRAFNNKGEVALFATIGAQAPGIGATMNGEVGFVAA